MGSIRQATWTRPLPQGAEVFTRGGECFARWEDQFGVRHEAPIAKKRRKPRDDGQDEGPIRVRMKSPTFVARYRSADGTWHEHSTGCTTRQAARHVLAKLEAEEDRIRCGRATRAEVDARDYELAPIEEHLNAYLVAPIDGRKSGLRTPRRIKYVKGALERVVADVGWRTLRDVTALDFKRWLEARAADGMSPGRRRFYISAAKAWLTWCVGDGRCASHPLSGIVLPKIVDRRKPRALELPEVELLLEGSAARPLHEAKLIRTGRRKGQLVARVSAEREAALRGTGMGRALAYKLMLLTGLRAEEAQSVRVGDVDIENDHPTIQLDGSRTKNGEPATVVLRHDLAEDIRRLLAQRLEAERAASRVSQNPVPARLDPQASLLRVPSGRVFDADLAFVEVDKKNTRGEVACRRSLRRTTCTWLYDLGASSAIVAAWMRHKGDTLSERVYTDRNQLDIRRWLDQLPGLSLDTEPRDETATVSVRATGTEGGGADGARLLTRESGLLTRNVAYCGTTSPNDVHVAGSGDSPSSSATRPPQARKTRSGGRVGVERLNGLEPSTSTLARLRSTTELQPLWGSLR